MEGRAEGRRGGCLYVIYIRDCNFRVHRPVYLVSCIEVWRVRRRMRKSGVGYVSMWDFSGRGGREMELYIIYGIFRGREGDVGGCSEDKSSK